jgi:hypothetical protein
MRRMVRTMAFGLALALAVPAYAAGEDARDTVTEKKGDVKRGVRHHKPGGETAGDKVEDAKDATRSGWASTKKKARKAAKKTRRSADRATSK